jgi:YD repeat-containing protein
VEAVRLQYGYDRAGNRTYREDPVDAGDEHDELYLYDGVYRITRLKRGALNASKSGIDSLHFAQCWSQDPSGNWDSFRQDDDGDTLWDLIQARTSNGANEITNVTETTGPSWAAPAYNRSGNMTTVPKPGAPTGSYTATYDAWNRLVKLADGATVVAEYEYDAAQRRTVKKTYAGGVLDETRRYYSSRWQVLEERVGASGDAQRQFLWGVGYIDDLLLRERDTTGDGSLDERLYGLQDASWNMSDGVGWLIGPFIDAWLKVYPQERAEARQLLQGLVHHLSEACIGSISEIFDAEKPFTPRGCIAQAWSVAEALRSLVATGDADADDPDIRE